MSGKRPRDLDDTTVDNVDLKWRRVMVGEAEIRLMSRKPNADRVVVHTPVALHGGLHVEVDPPPAIVFHSFDELTDALAGYFEATQQEFSIRNSITVEHANETAARSVRFPENDVRFKYSSMTYVCKHGRTQKRRNNPDLSKTKKVKFAYSGCQACLWIHLVLLGPPGARRWVYHVHKMVNVHNHDLSIENSVASLRPFRAYLDLIYDMKHAGATPQDMLTMLAAREPTKKITIQTVRNILRNYAVELAAPTPPPRLRPHQVPRLMHPSSAQSSAPAAAFHLLFSFLVKASIEQTHAAGFPPSSRFYYLNLCSIQSVLHRSWQIVQDNDAVNALPSPPPTEFADKTFHASVLTAVAADGLSPMAPFCVFPRQAATSGRLQQVAPNVVLTDHGLVTPDAMECAIMFFQASLPPRLPRPVVLVVDHATPSPALVQLCNRHKIVLVAWKDLYVGDKDIVHALRSSLLTPFEAQLCHQLGLVLPHLATTAAIVADLPAVVAHVHQTCVANVGAAAIASAFRQSGLHPPNLPLLAAATAPPPPLPKASVAVQEHRTATISVQSNSMPRFAVERRV